MENQSTFSQELMSLSKPNKTFKTLAPSNANLLSRTFALVFTKDKPITIGDMAVDGEGFFIIGDTYTTTTNGICSHDCTLVCSEEQFDHEGMCGELKLVFLHLKVDGKDIIVYMDKNRHGDSCLYWTRKTSKTKSTIMLKQILFSTIMVANDSGLDVASSPVNSSVSKIANNLLKKTHHECVTAGFLNQIGCEDDDFNSVITPETSTSLPDFLAGESLETIFAAPAVKEAPLPKIAPSIDATQQAAIDRHNYNFIMKGPQPAPFQLQKKQSQKPAPKPIQPPQAKAAEDPEEKQRRMSMRELTTFYEDTRDFIAVNRFLYLYRDGIYNPCDFAEFLRYSQTHLDEKEQRKHDISSLNSAYTYLSSSPEILLPEWPDGYRNWGAFQNGIYDFNHNQWHDYDRSILIFSRVQANFIPEDDLYSPNFDRFLDKASGGNPQVRALIMEVIGRICLLPDTIQKKFYALGAAPDSGKTVAGNFLRKLYGSDLTASLSLHDFNTNFGTSALLGGQKVL